MTETLDDKIARILTEYAAEPCRAPLDRTLSLRGDLAIDSLSLVSVMVRLGEELGVLDLEAWGAEISKIETVGDFVAFGHALVASTQPRAPSVAP
jgi:acyl carrier protein